MLCVVVCDVQVTVDASSGTTRQSQRNSRRRLARKRHREAKAFYNIVSKHKLNDFKSGTLGQPLSTRTRRRGHELRTPHCVTFNGHGLLFLDHGLEIGRHFGADGTDFGWGLKTLIDIPAGVPITQYQVRCHCNIDSIS